MKMRRPIALTLCIAVVGIVAWASSDSVMAQDEGDQKQPTVKKLGPDKQNEPVVGPPLPYAKRGLADPKTSRGRAKNRAIPAPTVTLKPGEIPKIEFDTPVYNFGRIRSGSDVRHDFWFTNTGTGPLEILRVKPS